MLTIHHPAGRALSDVHRTKARGLVSLDGARLAVLDNAKHNGGVLLGALADWLESECSVSRVLTLVKASTSMAAEDGTYAQIASASNCALTGPGDCGSCTSWSVHDAAELQRRGVPTICVVSEPFVALAKACAQREGIADLPLLVVPYPVSGLAEQAVLAKAAAATSDLRGLMLDPAYGK
jgi:hypothetical protein